MKHITPRNYMSLVPTYYLIRLQLINSKEQGLEEQTYDWWQYIDIMQILCGQLQLFIYGATIHKQKFLRVLHLHDIVHHILGLVCRNFQILKN